MIRNGSGLIMMANQILYLSYLLFLGLEDLRNSYIKNWQLIIFFFLQFLQVIFGIYVSTFILINFILISLMGFIGFSLGMVGAGDVKILALSSLSQLYSTHPWDIWLVGLITLIIDLILANLYFNSRKEETPLLFSWGLANLIYLLI